MIDIDITDLNHQRGIAAKKPKPLLMSSSFAVNDFPVPKQTTFRDLPHFREYAFLTSDKKLKAFNSWFQEQVQKGLLGSGQWTDKYIESAYKKGVLNAYLAAKKQDLAKNPAVGQQNQEDFLRQSFIAPERVSKVQLLATRTWENMRGISAATGTKMNQILSQGMIDGRGALDIAREMADSIDSMTSARALAIARTELIHAHAEGQLDSFADLGIEELGVDVEWSTASDDRVCENCADLEGETFTVDEARGLIPRHVNCRCAWIPSLDGKAKK